MKQLELYEREIIARERQADALERIADSLNITDIDLRFGMNNIAEALANLVYVIADQNENNEED